MNMAMTLILDVTDSAQAKCEARLVDTFSKIEQRHAPTHKTKAFFAKPPCHLIMRSTQR